MLFATRGWLPAFEFRPHETPLRNVVAAQDFQEIDDEATRLAKEEAMRFTEAVYDHDPEPLTQLKAEVQNDLAELAAFATWADVDQDLWAAYTPALATGTPEPSEAERQTAFEKFKAEITGEEVLPKIQQAISEIFAPLNTRGVLEVQPTDASSERIEVRPNGKDTFALKVPVSEVLQENLRNQLQKSLEQKLPSLDVASRVFARLKESLPITLKLNAAATRDARLKQAQLTPDVLKVYEQGSILAPAGKPIEEPELRLLRLEHEERLKQLTVGEQIGRAFAVLGMYLAVCTLCGFYANKIDPRLIRDLGRFITLLATCVLTVSVMLLVYGYGWRAEVIPLVLFAMTTAVAYQQEMALLLTASAHAGECGRDGHGFARSDFAAGHGVAARSWCSIASAPAANCWSVGFVAAVRGVFHHTRRGDARRPATAADVATVADASPCGRDRRIADDGACCRRSRRCSASKPT